MVGAQEKEIRAIQCSNVEIRAQEDGSKIIEGYAIKWDQLSVPLGYYYKFREKFQKGAFDDYLNANMDTKFLCDHDSSKVLGRTLKNTLTLSSDDVGLRFSLSVPQTTLGTDAHEDVKSGNKEYISVGFICTEDDWNEADEANIMRTVVKANLPEISLTAWPAYEQTSASARSIDDAYKEHKNKEKPLEIDYKTKNLRTKIDFLAKRYSAS